MVNTDGIIIAVQKTSLSYRKYQGKHYKIDRTEYVDWVNKKLNQLRTKHPITQSFQKKEYQQRLNITGHYINSKT